MIIFMFLIFFSRLLAKQRLMKLDRNNIHIYWNKISQKKSESVGQTLPQLPWKQKRGDLKKNWIPFIKLHETFIHHSMWQLGEGGLKKFKMAAVAMVTKVQKMLNSLPTSQSFAVMFPVTSTPSGTR